MKSSKVKQLGLSKEVWESENLQSYVKCSVVFGYVGASSRTAKSDRIVERELRAVGLGTHGVAEWLTSGSGRHMADNIERGQSEEVITKHVKGYAKDAFMDIVLWSHPDHSGSFDSSKTLEAKIADWVDAHRVAFSELHPLRQARLREVYAQKHGWRKQFPVGKEKKTDGQWLAIAES